MFVKTAFSRCYAVHGTQFVTITSIITAISGATSRRSPSKRPAAAFAINPRDSIRPSK